MRTRTRLLTCALGALLVASLAACSSPSAPASAPRITPVPTTTAEATDAASATTTSAGASSGGSTAATTTAPAAIVAPASGSASRAAILRALARSLVVSGSITVYQLYAQGGAAVGDVLLPTGKRTFFALTGGPKSWSLAWSARFGTSAANADNLVTAVPKISATLVAKLDFKRAVAAKATVPAPSAASLKTFALKTASIITKGSYTGTFTVGVTLAKSSSGSWWGIAVLTLSDPTQELEPITVFGHYSGTKWTGKIADTSSEDPEAAFFPADVITKLKNATPTFP